MFDICDLLTFGTRFEVDGVLWVRVAGCGDGTYCIAVRGDDKLPAVLHLVKNPSAKPTSIVDTEDYKYKNATGFIK